MLAAGQYKDAGHRKRLRDRFLQSGLGGFHDYEIIELLLTLGTPRKDCKQMAKNAIKKFGNILGILDASITDLQTIKGIGPSNVFGLKLFQAISEYLAKEKIQEKAILNSAKSVVDYLQKSIGRLKKEQFVVLSLDTHYRLIKISTISVGSLDRAVVHPREVFKEAIQASAAQIILAHNHSSDDPTPSPEDIALTRRLITASKIFDIEILDHVIVTKNKHFSLKRKGLM